MSGYMEIGGAPTDIKTVTLAADGEVLPAVPNKRYRIFGYVLSNLAASNVRFMSNATAISPFHYLPNTGGAVVPAGKTCWFRTAIGEALNLDMSVDTSVGVQVLYDQVDY